MKPSTETHPPASSSLQAHPETRESANAYGFVPSIVPGNVEDWIHDQLAHGARVAEWSGELSLYDGKAAKQPVLEVSTWWEALDWYSEGPVDLFVCRQEPNESWFLTFPQKGQEILEALREASVRGPASQIRDFTSEVQGNAFLLNQWGKVLSFTNKISEAGAAFRQSVETLTAYAEPYSNLGTLLWTVGKRREAMRLFAESFLKNPHRKTIQLNFFDAAHALEEFDFMAKVIEVALISMPEMTEFRHHLAICYHHLKRTAEAKKILEEILNENPDDREARSLLEHYQGNSAPLREQTPSAVH